MTAFGTLDTATLSSLPTRKARFVRCLLGARDIRAAARTAEVSERTARRWLREPEVGSALVAAEAEALEAVARSLVTLGGEAVAALERVLADPDTPPAVAVRAADVVLARLLQLRELVAMESRLTALEARLANNETERSGNWWESESGR